MDSAGVACWATPWRKISQTVKRREKRKYSVQIFRELICQNRKTTSPFVLKRECRLLFYILSQVTSFAYHTAHLKNQAAVILSGVFGNTEIRIHGKRRRFFICAGHVLRKITAYYRNRYRYQVCFEFSVGGVYKHIVLLNFPEAKVGIPVTCSMVISASSPKTDFKCSINSSSE